MFIGQATGKLNFRCEISCHWTKWIWFLCSFMDWGWDVGGDFGLVHRTNINSYLFSPMIHNSALLIQKLWFAVNCGEWKIWYLAGLHHSKQLLGSFTSCTCKLNQPLKAFTHCAYLAPCSASPVCRFNALLEIPNIISVNTSSIRIYKGVFITMSL